MNKVSIYVMVIILMAIAALVTTTMCGGIKDPYCYYYPADQTIPLFVESAISALPDKGIINASKVVTSGNNIYIYDSSRLKIFKFDENGEYIECILEGDEKALPTVSVGFDIDENENYVLSTLHTVVIGKRDNVKIFQNIYDIEKVIIADNKICAVLPNREKIIGIFDKSMKYQRSFGVPPCEGYGKAHIVQKYSYMTLMKGKIVLTSQNTPQYSVNDIERNEDHRYLMEDSHMKASLPIHKRELERFFKDYGELRSLVYGVDAVKDRLYFCFLSDESYLIQEIQKNTLKKVYKLDNHFVDSLGAKHSFTVSGFAALESEHGVKFVLRTFNDSAPILIVSTKQQKEDK